MENAQGGRPPVQMHQASVLVRQILVLNEIMEFIMRREMDLNETDFQAMQHLMKQRSMSPGELAKLLHLTAAATTTVIDRLARRGHITRTAHPTDRRRWLISPSEHSVRAAMEKLMPMIMDVDNKVRSYDDGEQAVIVDFLGSVVTAMSNRVQALEDGLAQLPPQPSKSIAERCKDHANEERKPARPAHDPGSWPAR